MTMKSLLSTVSLALLMGAAATAAQAAKAAATKVDFFTMVRGE